MNLGLSNIWNYGSTYCSLEHHTTIDDSLTIYGLTAKRKKDEFEPEEYFKVNDLQALKTKLKKNQHCFLHLTGDHVLIKSTTVSGTDQKIISSVFPNINSENFYYQILRSGPRYFVAVSRKDHVQDILRDYEKESIPVIGFSLGFSSIATIIDLLQEPEIMLSSYSLNIQDNTILDFSQSSEAETSQYLLGDTKVKASYLLALAGLFNYMPGVDQTDSNISEKNALLNKIFREKVFFRKGLVTGIVFLLCALLANFLLFSNYYNELQDLKGKHQLEISKKNSFQERLKNIEQKEKQVEGILNNSNSTATYYVNRLVTEIPEEVELNKLSFQPLRKPVKEDEPIELEENSILIEGISKDEDAFSEWITKLENTDWIEKTAISNFGYQSAGRSEFQVELKIREDAETE